MFEGLTALRLEDARFAELFPGGEFFLKGYIDGKLLDVPIARATLEARVASVTAAGTNAYFHAAANVPAGSWLDAFSPGASVEFELRGAPPRPIESVFSNRLAQARIILANPTEATVQASLNGFLNELQSKLPKIKLEANLPLRMPGSLSNLVRFNGGTRLAAYSARYEPGFVPADNRPVARARRDGGIAMEGNLEFRVNGAPLATVANGQLSVIPQPTGLPVLGGSFDVPLVNVGTIALRNNRLDFTADAAPRFSVRGSTDPLSFGIFRIDPISGPTLNGRFEVAQTGPFTTSGSLFLSPGRLVIGSAHHRIHGATPTNDFGFSSTGPWNATVTVSNTIRYAVGPQVLLEVADNNLLSPIAVSGVGLSSLTISGSIKPATSLTFFPGTAWAQSIQLPSTPAATFTLRSDGTFNVTGTLGSDLNLNGLSNLSVARVASGSTFTLTQDGLTLAGQLGGGVLAQTGGPIFQTAGSVTLFRNGTASSTGNSALSLPALGNSRVRVEALGGGNITATLGSTGLARSGARLLVDGIPTNGLPAFSIDRSGNFRLTNGPFNSPIGRFAASSVRYVLQRSGGVLSLQDFNAIWSSPALNSGLTLSGAIDSEGLVLLSATSTASGLGGHPLASFSGSLRRGNPAYASTVLNDAPLGYWHLNETSGTTAASSGTSGSAGTYNKGVTLGGVGPFTGSTAPRFDGNSGFVEITNSKPFDDVSTAITVEAWVRVNAFDRTWNTIASKGDSTWRLQRNGNLDTLGFDTDGLNPPYLAGNRSVNDGLWHHVVATYDGHAKALWIDGEPDAWTPATGNININPAFPVRIGENAQSTGRFWNGWLDEVAIYPRALNPAEIVEHIAAPERLPLGQGRIRVRDRTACSTSFSIPMAIPIPIPTRAAGAATSGWSGASIESQRDSGPQPGVAELARLPRVAVPQPPNRNAVVASSDPILQSRPGFPRWTPPQPRCSCSRVHG